MTKVRINPGICGFVTNVEAEMNDEDTVKIKIESDCEGIKKMSDVLDNEIDAFDAALGKPGCGCIYEAAEKCCPGHASCPVIAGIIKCIEVEAHLALPKDSAIEFIKE